MEKKMTVKVNVLKAELVLRGITQYQLAVALKVAPTKMSSLMTGRLSLEAEDELRAKVEEYLGLATGYFKAPAE